MKYSSTYNFMAYGEVHVSVDHFSRILINTASSGANVFTPNSLVLVPLM